MEQENRIILVTWDFTEKSEFALDHAINIAKVMHDKIGFIHIVKKQSDVSVATTKLEQIAEKKLKDAGIVPKYFVQEGSIFTTIGEIADDIKARMVIMGTHGMKGMQKFLGSWALKVIAGSKVPFLVVQSSPLNDRYKKIVFPVNYRRENKESINWAYFFSKVFHSHFHIFKAKNTDANFVKGVESNMVFIDKFFKSKNIMYDVQTAPGEIDFAKEAITFAKDVNADAILVMTTKDIGFADYVLGAHEQFIIANSEKIPVICINPRPAKLGGGFRTAGG